jgi:hypothetical protein
MTEKAPCLGASIVSVYHLHHGARVDGTSSIERMEEVPDPALNCELACAVAGQEAHHALTATGAGPNRLSPVETRHPRRWAA